MPSHRNGRYDKSSRAITNGHSTIPSTATNTRNPDLTVATYKSKLTQKPNGHIQTRNGHVKGIGKDIPKQLHPLRLVVLGSGGVGKSAITVQFVQQYFICDYDPTICDSYQKSCFVDENMWKLEVMDTAGQDEFASMREEYLRNGDGFLLVFSLTNRESLEYIKRLYRHIEKLKDRDFFPMLLVGNKCDLDVQRQISHEEAEAWANSVRIPYFECSAKYRLNVDQIFYDLVRLVRRFQVNERQIVTDQRDSGIANTSGSSGSSLKKKKACVIM